MKHIVQFIHGMAIGGAETLVKDYALRIDKNRYRITVLCRNRYGTHYDELLQEAGIPVVYLSDEFVELKWLPGLARRVVYRIQTFFLARKHLRGLQPDILHGHMGVNRWVKFARLPSSVCTVYTVHNEPQKMWFSAEGKTLRERWKRKADYRAARWLVKHRGMRLIVLHEKMRDEINRLFGVDNSIVLNNGIDFARFESARPGCEVRKELHIPQNAFVIGHVGRFVRQKNHSFLVEVYLEVRKRRREVYLLLIGDGALQQEIEERFAAAGVRDSVRILSGRGDVPDLLSAMDYFVFPSMYEGLAIAVVEAQKMCLPCLISDAVSSAVRVSNLVEFLPLEAGAAIWAEHIIRHKPVEPEYDDFEAWDMKYVVLRLQDIYEGRI